MSCDGRITSTIMLICYMSDLGVHRQQRWALSDSGRLCCSRPGRRRVSFGQLSFRALQRLFRQSMAQGELSTCASSLPQSSQRGRCIVVAIVF